MRKINGDKALEAKLTMQEGREKMPTILGVAKLAGVSVGSVSRVINNNSTVLPATRERVLQAIKTLGFQPNSVAQSMRQGSTRAVGCMVTDVSQAVAAQMLSGAEQALAKANYAVLVTSSHFDMQRELQNIDFFRQRKLDGLLLTITNDEDKSRAELLRRIGIPVVLWERDINGEFDAVITDHADGAYQATRYLISLGHSRILIVTGHQATLTGREQERGYCLAYTEAGLTVDDSLLLRTGSFSMTNCAGLLSPSTRPTAVIANIGDIPMVLKVAKTLRLSVPADLSIISIGETDLMEVLRPSITVVRGNGFEVGRTAAQMLLNLFGKTNNTVKQKVVFPAELVVRESCTIVKTPA
ncbi:LacI family DNA-binding transcriptional regulator [Glaciimonas sp. PCH181]|uniref:LacI family DNA-binding transcriptional regulator n=1 Tax=Glaciimonas sp. PCH181 TaxID=2133943 RepID=UPI000D35E175|nr:LacI family DNA-binding transcriptional regulator [Glaciimonas sp. PCH181]PUA18423.1 LacI family transcriptional regulator [Glaciimonas sp. PCH181]